jgi:hypothetical protein
MITLSYGGVTVDISQSEVTPVREARYTTLPVGNRYADITQAFGTYGFQISVRNGSFVGVDPRPIIWAWQKNNTPVTLNVDYPDQDDISGRNYMISKFQPKLVPGVPSSIIIYFSMDLSEVV